MHASSIRRLLLTSCLLLFAAASQAATTTYYLKSITFNTGNSREFPGGPLIDYNFGSSWQTASSLLSLSTCNTCVEFSSQIVGGTGLAVLDDVTNNVSITNLDWSLRNFGANFREISAGVVNMTNSYGTGYVKSSDSCTLVVGPSGAQYCSATDIRSYLGNWLNGFKADGITGCNNCEVEMTLNSGVLTMRLRKPLTTADPVVADQFLPAVRVQLPGRPGPGGRLAVRLRPRPDGRDAQESHQLTKVRL